MKLTLTFEVAWSEEEKAFVGTCAQFPALSWIDALQDGALFGIIDVVQDCVRDMITSGEPLPLATQSEGERSS